MNTFGRLFTLTTFGESHGTAVGGVVDGMPSGITVDMDYIQYELSRRRPGQNSITTGRCETDTVELLSGVFNGVTTGCPIAFMVRNEDQHSNDYDDLKDKLRPSHADYTYYYKYGTRDYRGGGRSSARVTVSRVVAGALAKLALRQRGISITAYTSQIGDISLRGSYNDYSLADAKTNTVRCPDAETAIKMERLLTDLRNQGDSTGGVVTCVIKGCPPGIGEPEAGKLHAALAAAMMSINAAKGFEYGSGFEGVKNTGSQENDVFLPLENGQGAIDKEQGIRLSTASNNSGGIQGGISNGQDIYFRVAFKPVATIFKQQDTVDVYGNTTTIMPKGRHDPCVVPRAVPIVEAMAAITLLDYYLIARANKF